ncbi:MAG: mechanosensitive ion channel family protein [Magnetococcales bacterium]|nr:mechanosensitive ion channel family protein [Magnetococcales bacterium]
MNRFISPKIAWLLQATFATLFVISAEGALLHWLVNKVSVNFLNLIILGFDLVWWALPAYLLNLAIERFFWISIESRTGQIIPNIIRNFVASIIYILAVFGIIAFVFNQQITGLLATSGMIAMIIGLAIQVNISNIFSGIAINLEQPFRIGDWVKVGEFQEGKVTNITWRSTTILDRNNVTICIPNSTAAESSIKNFTYPEKNVELWFEVFIDPRYRSTRISKLLLDAALSTPGVLATPAPYAKYKGMSDWASVYIVGYVIDDYGKKSVIKNALWSRIEIHLGRAGITPALQRLKVNFVEGDGGYSEKEVSALDLINEIEIFNPFSVESKKILSDSMKRIFFPMGQNVVTQGESGDSMFCIVEGTVGVVINIGPGKTLEVARLGAGTFFGEMALLTGEPRTASIVAVSDIYVYEITKDDLVPLINKQPEVSMLISKILTERQIATESKKTTATKVKIDEKGLMSQFFNKIQNFFGSK